MTISSSLETHIFQEQTHEKRRSVLNSTVYAIIKINVSEINALKVTAEEIQPSLGIVKVGFLGQVTF